MSCNFFNIPNKCYFIFWCIPLQLYPFYSFVVQLTEDWIHTGLVSSVIFLFYIFHDRNDFFAKRLRSLFIFLERILLLSPVLYIQYSFAQKIWNATYFHNFFNSKINFYFELLKFLMTVHPWRFFNYFKSLVQVWQIFLRIICMTLRQLNFISNTKFGNSYENTHEMMRTKCYKKVFQQNNKDNLIEHMSQVR